MRILLFIATLLLAQGALAQPESTQMQAGRTADGVVYFLPKTAVHFRLLIEKRTYTPGQFARYAERYLRLSEVSDTPEESYSIADFGITMTGVRDTSKCYAVRLKGGLYETAEVKLNDEGILQAVNDEPIAAKVRPPFRPSPQPPAADPRQLLSADVLAAGSRAKMAELTARQILDLREHRQQLITGEADDMPQDEHQLRLMISLIDQQHDALMTLFTGTTRRDTTEHTITLCPEKETQHELLFRISRRLGLVDNDDLSGVPYYIAIQDPGKTDRQKYPLADNKKEGGFYVNVPSPILLTLSRQDDTLATFTLPLAQFGFVALRGGQQFKRYVTHMTLHPATGAIERIYSDAKQ